MYAPSPRHLPPMIPDDSEFLRLSQSMSRHRPDEVYPPVDMDFLADFESSMEVVDDDSEEEDGMVEVAIPLNIPQVANTEAFPADDDIDEPSPTTESFVTPTPTPLQQETVVPNDTPASPSVSPTRELSKREKRALTTRTRRAAPQQVLSPPSAIHRLTHLHRLAPVPAHLRSGHISALDVALGRRKQPDWMKTGQVTTLPRAREAIPCEAPGRKRTRSTEREAAGAVKKARTVPPPIPARPQSHPRFFSSAPQVSAPSTMNATFDSAAAPTTESVTLNAPTTSSPSSSNELLAFTRKILTLTPTNHAAFTKKYNNLPAHLIAQIICADVPILTPSTTVICPQDHACVLLSEFERHVEQSHRPHPGNSFKCVCHGSKIQTFATAREMVEHMRTSHLVETKFRCLHCPKLIVPVEKNMRDHLLRNCHGMETFE